MRTTTFSAAFALLLSILLACSPAAAGEPKPSALAKSNPNLMLAAPTCPAGFELDRVCRSNAEKSAKGGAVDYSRCPCVRTVAAAPAQGVKPARMAPPRLAEAPLINTAPTANTCAIGLTSATNCGGTCVDTRTDVHNCGRCANQCNSTLVCQAGVCACPAGQHQQSGVCVAN